MLFQLTVLDNEIPKDHFVVDILESFTYFKVPLFYEQAESMLHNTF